jgi:hypothetical protein
VGQLTGLPLAGAGSGLLPPRIVLETSGGPPLRAPLPPAAGAASGITPLLVADAVFPLTLAGGGAGSLGTVVRLGLLPPPQPPYPAWQRDTQDWAVRQERQRHAQALWEYGELVMFALLWHTADYQAGLCTRCPRCFTGNSTAESQIAAAYAQGNQAGCPVCFNSSYADWEGVGWRAIIVRPAIFTDTDRDEQRTARGVMRPAGVSIESTPDFRVRPQGDYCLRSDGTRWYLRVPRRSTLRTGFATPWQQAENVGYNLMNASLEDLVSPAYLIPPAQQRLAQVLGTYTRLPADYSWAESIRGPLIPEEAPPPAALGEPQPPVSFPLAAP